MVKIIGQDTGVNRSLTRTYSKEDTDYGSTYMGYGKVSLKISMFIFNYSYLQGVNFIADRLQLGNPAFIFDSILLIDIIR